MDCSHGPILLEHLGARFGREVVNTAARMPPTRRIVPLAFVDAHGRNGCARFLRNGLMALGSKRQFVKFDALVVFVTVIHTGVQSRAIQFLGRESLGFTITHDFFVRLFFRRIRGKPFCASYGAVNAVANIVAKRIQPSSIPAATICFRSIRRHANTRGFRDGLITLHARRQLLGAFVSLTIFVFASVAGEMRLFQSGLFTADGVQSVRVIGGETAGVNRLSPFFARRCRALE